MVTYDSSDVYIQSKATLQAKIEAVDAMMTALETNVLKAVGKGDVEEYMLDDGQTRIRTTYRSTKEVIKSIQDLEAIRQMYVNRYNGRGVRLVDGKNFTGKRYGRN